jgi:hypothetical protein
MARAERPQDRQVFHLDHQYQSYINNKRACRKEQIRKYFCEEQFLPQTAFLVNHYIANQMVKEHPNAFKLAREQELYSLLNKMTGEKLHWGKDWIDVIDAPYLSLFDALSSQLQEDFAVCQLQDQLDWMAAIHLCAPNHWAAADKIGKSFDVVHAPVPGMEKTMPHYGKMLQTIVQKGPFTRFVWGLATDTRLNHHPVEPPGMDPALWKGRKPQADHPELCLRVERQNLVGFPDAQAFLFTIRTFHYEVDALDSQEKDSLLSAIESMSEASLAYKGISFPINQLRHRFS